MSNPTLQTYTDLTTVYQYLNEELFNSELPPCLITMQRKNKAYGYFSGNRFTNTLDQQIADEIALNPLHFNNRQPDEILSTLAHEMVHLWQHHNGTPSRSGYHNKQWAVRMKAIGLIPTSTGQEGGKETGQSVTHMIEAEGIFYKAIATFLSTNQVNLYYDNSNGDEAKKKKKAESKTKYTCPSCDMNAWGKLGINLVCGDCEERMLVE